MSTQPSLFEPVAHARRSDPRTSKDAAASVRRIRESQADVLTIIRRYGPVSDEDLIRQYRNFDRDKGMLIIQSDSGIRTRRSELVRLGAVVDSGLRGRTASNRQTVLWKVAQ